MCQLFTLTISYCHGFCVSTMLYSRPNLISQLFFSISELHLNLQSCFWEYFFLSAFLQGPTLMVVTQAQTSRNSVLAHRFLISISHFGWYNKMNLVEQVSVFPKEGKHKHFSWNFIVEVHISCCQGHYWTHTVQHVWELKTVYFLMCRR